MDLLAGIKRILIPGGAGSVNERNEGNESSKKYDRITDSDPSSIDRLYQEITRDLTPSKLRRIYVDAENGDLSGLFSAYKKAVSYDGRLKGASSKRIKAPSRFDFEIKAKDKDLEKTSEVIEFVKKSIEEIKMKKLVQEVSKSSMYGVSGHIINYKKSDNYLVPLQPKPIPFTRFMQNNSYQLSKFNGGIFGELLINTGKNYLSARKLKEDGIIILSEYDVERAHYDLGGFMRSAVRYFLMKNYASMYWMSNSEQFGSPLRIMKIPRGHYDMFKEQIDAFFSSTGRNKYGVTYDDWEVEVIPQSKNGGSDIFKDLVAFCNTESEIAIHGQSATTESQSGGYSSTKIFKEDEINNIIDDSEEVEEVISDCFINDIIEKNFPSYPKGNIYLWIDKPSFKDFKQIKDKYELAGRMGLTVSKSAFEKETGIKLVDKDSDDALDLKFNEKGIDKFNDNPDRKKEERTDAEKIGDE